MRRCVIKTRAAARRPPQSASLTAPQKGSQGRCGAGGGRSMSAPTAEWNLLCEFTNSFAKKRAGEGRCGHRHLRTRRSVVRKYDCASTAGWGHPALRKILVWAQQLSPLRGRAHPSPPLQAVSILVQATLKRALRRGGTPSVTASPCHLPQRGRQGARCKGGCGHSPLRMRRSVMRKYDCAVGRGGGTPPYGVGRRPVRNSRRARVSPPYAKF